MPHDHQRPDPDALLAQMREQERRAARGRLRIYFGASAGVGKTYAMLQEARKLLAEGSAPLVGVIETHGRAETARLLEGLELLPRRRIDYRGKTLEEFDLDAALARAPAVILVDELAHSNAPGSRHPKRWQDVEELLAAGIDVLTTVNVQHLESLNDVVGGIAGIRVAETVPDRVFDSADEIVMVDLTADALLARLKEGKVYQPQQAERAAGNFFKKGNLIALRELALRRTADRVEGDVRAWREEQSIDAIWKTGAGLLVCLGPDVDAEHVVRSGARMASQLGTGWHAVYVETARLGKLPEAARARIMDTLKLAHSLGATTAVLSGDDVAASTLDYARDHNFSRIALGRDGSRWPWRRSTARRLARLAPGVDLIEIGQPAVPPTAVATTATETGARPRPPLMPHVWAAGASVLTAVVTMPLRQWLDPVNIVMLFLLVVLLVAVRFGRAPSVTTTCIGVASFDFFFVPPRFNFAVSDVQYLVTFGVMLAVGLITGHLTAGLRFQARVAAQRERRVRALYEFARELSGALAASQVFESSRAVIQNAFGARATLLVPDADERLGMPPAEDGGAADAVPANVDLGIAQWAYDHAQPAGLGTDTLPACPLFYLPLVAPMRTRGVLAIEPEGGRWVLIPEQRRQLDALAALAAIALERVHYVEVAQAALVSMESERLRNSLLAALSHDLRTPLTALVGLSESLLRGEPPLADQPLALAQALHDEAVRMGTLVANLLDMARIESGEVRFNLEWQALEEVIGSALRACGAALRQHTVTVRLPPGMPLVRFDAVLIERVLCNLVENAAKYTPVGARIEIGASVRGAWIDVTVSDNGPGLRAGSEETIFEKFTRGERESALPGVGLGLAICRAIVGAHGGTIRACESPLGGAGFVFSLPAGTPPELDLLSMETNDD
jgi:two-component system sensor histidine kinase KdpD